MCVCVCVYVCAFLSLQRLIAFRNSTANTCYIDRLDETFAEGYARWQGFEVGIVYSVCVFVCVCVSVCVCVCE